MIGQVGRIVVLLTGIVVLSRLLTPADYGLMAMILAIIGIAEVFRDFGLSSAAIQARTLSHAERSNLFWAGGAIGIVLAILIVGASWPISWLYQQPQLQPLTVLLAAVFVFSGFTTQFTAELNRSLKLGRLIAGEIAGQVIGLATGIILALSGFGVWALAFQQVVQAFATMVILWIVSSWSPGLYSRDVSLRPFIRYGAGVAGAQLLGYLSRNVDTMVIGARFGAAQLGLYNRAFQLMLLPLNQVNAPAMRVALPVLSRLQDDPARFRRYILAGQFAMLMTVGALIALCFAQAPAIILVAVGDQWTAAVPVFRILAIGGLLQAAGTATYWCFLALGLTTAQFQLALVTRPIMIGLIILGAVWSTEGVAWMYSASLFMTWLVGLLWLGRVSDAPVRDLLWSGVRGVVVISLAAGASYASTLWLGDTLPFVSIALGAVVVGAVIVLAVLVVPVFRRDALTVIAQVRDLRSRD